MKGQRQQFCTYSGGSTISPFMVESLSMKITKVSKGMFKYY